MGQMINLILRKTIIEMHQRGLKKREISEQTGVSYATVKLFCARYDSESGNWDLKPHYEACGKLPPNVNSPLYQAAIGLRRLQPDWGAALICLKLTQQYPDWKVPTPRTLQYWFKKLEIPKPKTVLRTSKIWAKSAHMVWQTDAKEQQHLINGSAYCYLTITDEFSGGIIAAPIFPL
jgi:hypothetical protein